MKRILLYNWARIDENTGGGVTVYLRNLINYLIQLGEYEIFFINSGLTYTIDGRTRLVCVKNKFSSRLHTYEILNAPFIAPVRLCSKNLKEYLNDKRVALIMHDFIVDNNITTVHYHNFEGLSIETLKLKESLRSVTFLYTAHNYFAVCSRGNLWKDSRTNNGHNCDCYDDSECYCCYEQRNYTCERIHRVFPNIRGIGKLSYLLGTNIEDNVYKDFHMMNIQSINKYIDKVFAVSERVRKILIKRGINEDRVITSYIGTEVANYQTHKSNSDHKGYFHVMYMAYMQPEKGFYFFVDAMEKLDKRIAKGIVLHIVARHDSEKNKKDLIRINELKESFADVRLINGYSKENQKNLLQGIDLGVVPVLWEDNLPQIAIEQLAYGVPIITSDLGGAKELFEDDRFVFVAGDSSSFLNRIEFFYHNRNALDEFWNTAKTLVTMKTHVNEISVFYE